MAARVGKFISVEGGEGVGKSSFIEALTERLGAKGLDVVGTREPGGTPTAQAIRQIFMSPPGDDPLDVKAELFLVSAARCQHLQKLIKPSLKKGSWVICDRFHDSTRVYQGVGGGVPEEKLETLIDLSVGDSHPDLTFLLDCDVQVAMERVAGRAESEESGNRYDEASASFYKTLRDGFLTMARRFPDRIVVLDASQTKDHVLGQALEELERRFGLKFNG